LVRELVERARLMHKHAVVAGIDADNAASIGLHESLGFRRAGHLHQVGFKFGRWLDLVFLELLLS
jgi:phosphinothricin acetyltransferase